MSRLRPLDYFQIATTALLVVLGLIILIRSRALGAPAPSYAIGLAFLAYGVYRGSFILRALRGARKTG
jgi:hypothetical protein